MEKLVFLHSVQRDFKNKQDFRFWGSQCVFQELHFFIVILEHCVKSKNEHFFKAFFEILLPYNSQHQWLKVRAALAERKTNQNKIYEHYHKCEGGKFISPCLLRKLSYVNSILVFLLFRINDDKICFDWFCPCQLPPLFKSLLNYLQTCFRSKHTYNSCYRWPTCYFLWIKSVIITYLGT